MPTMIARPPSGDLDRQILAQDGDGEQGREERSGSARNRVDQGQIAPAVALLEEQEICHVQRGAADVEADLAPPHGGAFDKINARHDRQVDQDRENGKQPDEFRPAVDALDQQVPGGVTKSCGQHQREGKECHGVASAVMRHTRFVQGHRLAQRFGRFCGRIESGEDDGAVFRREEGAFILGNRETGLLQRGAWSQKSSRRRRAGPPPAVSAP